MKLGLVYINGSRKNLFITLTYGKKVQFITSAGRVRESAKKNRRYKKSPGAMINLAERLHEALIKKNLLNVNVIVKITPKFIIKNFLKELGARGITIEMVKVKIPYTFSKVREKKLRRV